MFEYRTCFWIACAIHFAIRISLVLCLYYSGQVSPAGVRLVSSTLAHLYVRASLGMRPSAQLWVRTCCNSNWSDTHNPARLSSSPSLNKAALSSTANRRLYMKYTQKCMKLANKMFILPLFLSHHCSHIFHKRPHNPEDEKKRIVHQLYTFKGGLQRKWSFEQHTQNIHWQTYVAFGSSTTESRSI